MALIMRHHLVLMSRFEPHEYLRLIADHQVTFMVTVPTIMQRALPVYQADPGSYDLSSIRRFWHLAAPCPPTVKEAWIDLLGPEKVWELYGGTELQAMTFISGDQWLAHRGSVGIVVVGEMKVLDDDGNRCPPGVVKTRSRPASLQRRSVAGETPRTLLASERLIQSGSTVARRGTESTQIYQNIDDSLTVARRTDPGRTRAHQ